MRKILLAICLFASCEQIEKATIRYGELGNKYADTGNLYLHEYGMHIENDSEGYFRDMGYTYWRKADSFYAIDKGIPFVPPKKDTSETIYSFNKKENEYLDKHTYYFDKCVKYGIAAIKDRDEKSERKHCKLFKLYQDSMRCLVAPTPQLPP